MGFKVHRNYRLPSLTAAIAASALAGSALAEPPAYPTLPPDLARAATAFDRAQLTSDGPALAALLADDYRLVNSGGDVETKADFIKDYVSDFHLDPFIIQQSIQTVWKDGAVLGGVVHFQGVSAGKRFDTWLRFADVWARRDGRWVVVYTQAAKAKQP